MKEREPEKRDLTMEVFRAFYNVVDELVMDVDKRDEYFELIDEAVEQLKETKTNDKRI